MKRIEEFVSIVDLGTREERHIYLRFEKALGHIREDPKNFDLFRMHTKRWMTTEIGISYPYPSASWHDVEELLGDDLIIIARSHCWFLYTNSYEKLDSF